jgi:Protein O-mannosyl-transferase TMEM260-like
MVRRQRLVASLLVGLVALVAASFAMLPGVAFWDTGELQAVAPLMGTAHPTGFPTYVLVGWLASVLLQPFGEPAFLMNLLSAICVAVAAGVTVDLVRRLTGHLALGIAAGLGLALMPTAWAMATHAETHTLHLAFVAILLWLLVAWDDRVRAAATASDPKEEGIDASGASAVAGDGVDRGDRFLVAAAAVFGLALGNHSLTILLAIPVGLYVLAVDPSIWRRPRLVLTCTAVLVLTVLLVYLELPLRAGPFRAPLVYGTPDTWEGFKYIVLAEQFRDSVIDPFGELPRKLGTLVDRTATQFGVLAPFIPIGFIATAVRRPRYALLTGTAAILTCFFAASYVNADISRYYLGPELMAWTWLAILAGVVVDGVASMAGWTRATDGFEDVDATDDDNDATEDVDEADESNGMGRPAPWTPVAALALVVAIALIVPTLLEIPARHAAVDSRRQLDAATWTDHALAVMEPDAAIISWWSYSTPLWYAQRVEGRRPDIAIIDDRTRLDENLGSLTDVIDANLGKRPVYVIRLDPNEVRLLADLYDLDSVNGGDARTLTRVIGRKGS